MWLDVSSKQSNRLVAVVSYAYTFASLVHGAAMRRARGARELHVRAFGASTAQARALALTWRAQRELEHVWWAGEARVSTRWSRT